MHRGEYELDRPFRRQPLGLQRIGEAEAADGEIGPGGADAVELPFDVLAFGDHRAFGQEVEIGAEDVAVQVGGADLDRGHAAFAGEEAGERRFELAVGQEEQRLAVQRRGMGGDGLAGAGAGGGGDLLEERGRDAELGGDGGEPGGGALFAEGEGGRDVAGAAADQGGMGVAEEGLGQGEDGVRPDAGQLLGGAGGQAAHRADAERLQERQRLILDHIGQRADQQQLARLTGGQGGDHGGEASVFALGEGRLDAGAAVIVDPDRRRVQRREPLGGAMQVELDHLGGAGADEEELADVGPAGQKPRHLAVELGIGVGKAGEILLFEDGGAEARLGEDHHPRGGLQQMGAGARAHHEEEGVLHLAVQPDDAGQPAEHLTLAAFLQDRRGAATAGGRDGKLGHGHRTASRSRRARRSFHRNCPALMT